MYKFIISWRYLLTRYIALASVISMTLGVAAMIVVNAVMLGFTTEMEHRLHGMLSDVTVQVLNADGIPNPEADMQRIMAVAGDKIEGISPIVATVGFLSFRYGDRVGTHQVKIIGIDPGSQGSVSCMQQYLQHPENRRQIEFFLREGGYDVISTQSTKRAIVKPDLEEAGWEYRRNFFAPREHFRKISDDYHRMREEHALQAERGAFQSPAPEPLSFGQFYDQETQNQQSTHSNILQASAHTEIPQTENDAESNDETGAEHEVSMFGEGSVFDFSDSDEEEEFVFDGSQHASESSTGGPSGDYTHDVNLIKEFDPAKEEHPGIILGVGLALWQREEVQDESTGKWQFEDQLFLRPGDDVTLSFPTTGRTPQLGQGRFTVVDLFESRMSEHDGEMVFVPISVLQDLRGMVNRQNGTRSATQIMIKAKPGVDINELRDTIRAEFSNSPNVFYSVQTWRDSQEHLINAVFTEVAMLNVLLLLIFAVAGFGILAIFFMIVVEKSKDIGILKSLGASGAGIMQIFLFYSFALGTVGAVAGIGLGLIIVAYIKEIAEFISWIRGHNVFDPAIYAFAEIPAVVQPWTVCWIVTGAILIAVCSGVLPALRAAKLNPVETLRS